MKAFTFIVVLVAFTSFFASILPSVKAEETKITTFYPANHHAYVGDTVRILGKVAVTGSYKTVFGNSTNPELLKIENTTSVVDVDVRFNVPHVFGGNYTVTLEDANGAKALSWVYVDTKYIIGAVLPTAPSQLQQGAALFVWVNITGSNQTDVFSGLNVTVTTPKQGETFFNSSLTLQITGYGNASKQLTYPDDFSPVGGHTNYTGTYTLKFIKTSNQAVLAQSLVVIGLTNATEYHRFDPVNIHAAGYPANTQLKLNITSSGKLVYTNTTLMSDSLGILDFNWYVPKNASIGAYTVTIANATSGQNIKSVKDSQSFSVPGFLTNLFARNLSNETVPNVSFRVWELQETSVVPILSNKTGKSDSTGKMIFMLEIGTYVCNGTFKSVSIVPVQAINISRSGVNATGNWDWNITCSLAHLEIVVIDDKTDLPLPFIHVDFNYTYWKVDGKNTTEKQEYELDPNGFLKVQNLFPEISYTVNTSRYGYSFNQTTFKLPTQPVFNLNITCPVLSLTVKVLESHGYDFAGAYVEVNEWSSGVGNPAFEGSTNSNGALSTECTFGKYRLRVFESADRKVLLNQTDVYLVLDPTDLTVHCSIYDLVVSVKVVDYFGQPLGGVEVKIEREGVEPYVSTTDADGVANFPTDTRILIGGDCRISAFLMGQTEPAQTATLYLGGSQTVTLKIAKYTVFAGLILETSQLATIIGVIVMTVLLLGIVIYKAVFKRRIPEKKTEN